MLKWYLEKKILYFNVNWKNKTRFNSEWKITRIYFEFFAFPLGKILKKISLKNQRVICVPAAAVHVSFY